MPACLIEILDEVNCRIKNLDLDARRKLVAKFKFEVPYAKYLPAVRLGRWDGKTAYFQLSGLTFVNLLPEIIEWLTDRNYTISLDDQRPPSPQFKFEAVAEDSYSAWKWPKGHPAEGQPIMLRDYQVEIINSFLSNRQCLQEVATGAGKCLAGNTLIEVTIDESSPFGKFMQNELQQENKTATLSIEKLASIIEKFNQKKLINNEEISTKEFNLLVPTLQGNAKVNHFIKKFNLPMIGFEFDNGYIVHVAQNHILQQHGIDVFAKDLTVGAAVDHRNGKLHITAIIELKNDDCYDISINHPHLYYDANGLIHHNTLMTAVLSHKCEPYGRTLVIVPNKSLVTQTEDDYKNMNLDVGVYFGDRKELGRKHTICTWQSLNIMLKNKDKDTVDFITFETFIEDVVAVIVDECFDGDVLITTPNGKTPIKNLKSGDKVINLCENTNQYKEDVIVKVHKNLTNSRSEKMLELEFDNGIKIQVTANHKFLTNKGWIRADQLTDDLEIINTNTLLF